MDALPEGSDVGVVPEEGDEVLELRAGLLLELEGDLQGLVQEDRDLLEVLLEELAGGEGGGADADSARRDHGGNAKYSALIPLLQRQVLCVDTTASTPSTLR